MDRIVSQVNACTPSCHFITMSSPIALYHLLTDSFSCIVPLLMGTLSQLLAEMDGMDGNADVFVLGQ